MNEVIPFFAINRTSYALRAQLKVNLTAAEMVSVVSFSCFQVNIDTIINGNRIHLNHPENSSGSVIKIIQIGKNTLQN